MSDMEGMLQGNPTERVVVPVTNNATLECSRFCLTNCGLFVEAQALAVISSMMVTGKPVSADFGEESSQIEIQVEEGSRLPELVMTCKGPRKKHWIAGELVCPKRAKTDTV